MVAKICVVEKDMQGLSRQMFMSKGSSTMMVGHYDGSKLPKYRSIDWIYGTYYMAELKILLLEQSLLD